MDLLSFIAYKYNPKVINGIIHYKTGTAEPYYFAEISRKGDKFICKIYKRKKDGDKIRLRNKLKKTLKTAHNYVREYLNQKLKKDEMRRRETHDFEEVIREPVQREIPTTSTILPPAEYQAPPKSKTIIRRF